MRKIESSDFLGMTGKGWEELVNAYLPTKRVALSGHVIYLCMTVANFMWVVLKRSMLSLQWL